MAILARDPVPPYSRNSELVEEYESITKKLNIEPVTFIPSNLEEDYITWIAYLYYINANTGRTFAVSPALDRFFRKCYRFISGHHLFIIIRPPSLYSLTCLLSGLIDVASYSSKLLSFLKLLIDSGFTRAIRFYYIVIQTPPLFNHEKNSLTSTYSIVSTGLSDI